MRSSQEGEVKSSHESEREVKIVEDNEFIGADAIYPFNSLQLIPCQPNALHFLACCDDVMMVFVLFLA